jgi:tetratricopeptide (TPR) repeat protein
VALAALLVALAACTSTTTTAPPVPPPSPALAETKEAQGLRARAAYERGLVFLREGQPGAALASLQEATRLDPTAALYANTMGVVLLQQFRQLAGALAWLERATLLDPQYGDAQLNYAVALAEAALWDRAIEGYRKALALPTLTVPHVAHQNLGLALYHLKRYPEAEESIRFALSLEPQMVGAHYNLGLVLLALGKKDDAVAAFRKEQEMAPRSSDFHKAAGQRLKDLGQGGGLKPGFCLPDEEFRVKNFMFWSRPAGVGVG